MSEESTTPVLVELWRQGCEAFNRGDLDATLRLHAPDAAMDMTRTLGITAKQGREAFQRGDVRLLRENSALDVVIAQPPEIPDTKRYEGSSAWIRTDR